MQIITCTLTILRIALKLIHMCFATSFVAQFSLEHWGSVYQASIDLNGISNLFPFLFPELISEPDQLKDQILLFNLRKTQLLP